MQRANCARRRRCGKRNREDDEVRVLLFAAALGVAMLAMSGCGGSDAKPKPLRVKLTLAAHNPARPYLTGTTNLPSGTQLELMLELHSEAYLELARAHPGKPAILGKSSRRHIRASRPLRMWLSGR
jgi:hypothetical protein